MAQTQEVRYPNGFRILLVGDKTSVPGAIKLLFEDPATGETILSQEFHGLMDEVVLVYEGMKKHYKRFPREQAFKVCSQLPQWPGASKRISLPPEPMGTPEAAFYFACFFQGAACEETDTMTRKAAQVYEKWLEKHPLETMTPLDLLSYSRPGSRLLKVDPYGLEEHDYEHLKTLEYLFLFGHSSGASTDIFRSFTPSPEEEKGLIEAVKPLLNAGQVHPFLEQGFPGYEKTYQEFTRAQAKKFFSLRFAAYRPAFELALEELLEDRPLGPVMELTPKITPLLKNWPAGERKAYYLSQLAHWQEHASLTAFLNEAIEAYEEDEAARAYIDSYFLCSEKLFNVDLPHAIGEYENHFNAHNLDYYVYSLLSKHLPREELLRLGAELNCYKDPTPVDTLEAFLASYEEYKEMPVSWWVPLLEGYKQRTRRWGEPPLLSLKSLPLCQAKPVNRSPRGILRGGFETVAKSLRLLVAMRGSS